MLSISIYYYEIELIIKQVLVTDINVSGVTSLLTNNAYQNKNIGIINIQSMG